MFYLWSSRAFCDNKRVTQCRLQAELFSSVLRGIWKSFEQLQRLGKMSDRLLVGRKPHRSLSRLPQIAGRLGHRSRHLEVPGELDGHFLGLSLVQLLYGSADRLVKVNPLHVVQAGIQIPLKEDMSEPVLRQPLPARAHPPAALALHQPMLPVQLTAQLLNHRRLVHSAGSGQHLGREEFAFHTRGFQSLLQRCG